MDKLKFNAGKPLSHAYIIAAGEAASNEFALELAAAMLCSGEGARPCGACRNCRKVHSGVHPDLAILEPEVDDKGKRREIPVAKIRDMVSDAQIMPNEADRKVYLIKYADLLSVPAQNAMLKLIEEPPGNVSFILCAENAANLLDTLRSRCVLLRENSEREPDVEAAKLAETFVSLALAGGRAPLLQWCTENEGMNPYECAQFVSAARAKLAEMLCRGGSGTPPRRCMKLDALLSRAADYLKLNTGVKHVLGFLAVDGIGGNQY